MVEKTTTVPGQGTRNQGFPVFVFLAASIILLKVSPPHWKSETADGLLDVIGVGLIFLGFLLRISARGYKIEISSNGKRHVLVTNGPYALTRNPMYMGALFIGFGIVCMVFNWLALPILLITYSVFYIPQIRSEEQMLRKEFRYEYLAYQQRTPRYFPRVSTCFKANVLEYLPLELKWVKKELVSLLGILGIVIAMDVWWDKQVFGHLHYGAELWGFFLMAALAVFFVFRFKNRNPHRGSSPQGTATEQK